MTMAIEVRLDPALTDELRERIVGLWVEVTNTGGAVGFVGPVTADDVRATAEEAFAGVDAGLDRLLAAYEGDELVGLLFLMDNRFVLKNHWRVLKRVMISPRGQGRGYGSTLMRAAEKVAREVGLEGLQLTVRGGVGIDEFYKRLGYREVGRIPGALRIGEGDDRDEIFMWLPLV